MRSVGFGGVWLALTGADPSGWPLAVAVVGAATAASLAAAPPRAVHVRWLAVPRFLGFFLAQALMGGIDVARRALDPRMPIEPGFLHQPTQLAPGVPRLLLAWTVSLLPGTVSAELTDDGLHVHALDVGADVGDRLAQLEERIASLFSAG